MTSRYVDKLKDRMQFEIFIMVSCDLLRYMGVTEETIKDVFEKRGVRDE